MQHHDQVEQPKPDKEDETNSDEHVSTTTLKIPKELEGRDVLAKAPFANQSSDDSYNKRKDKESKSKDSDSKTIDTSSKSHNADEDEMIAYRESIDNAGNEKIVADGTPVVALKSHDTEKDKEDTESRKNDAADSKDNVFNSNRNILHNDNNATNTTSASNDNSPVGRTDQMVSMRELLAVSIDVAKRGGQEVKRIREQASSSLTIST